MEMKVDHQAGTYLARVKSAQNELLQLTLTIVVLVLVAVVAGGHLAQRLSGLLSTVHSVGRVLVEVHFFLGQGLELLRGGLTASLLGLRRIAWSTLEILVVVAVLIVILLLLSKHSLHLVNVEFIVLLIALVVEWTADELQSGSRNGVVLALWLSRRVDGSHSDAEC